MAGYSTKDVAYRFNVVPRTIYRHLKTKGNFQRLIPLRLNSGHYLWHKESVNAQVRKILTKEGR